MHHPWSPDQPDGVHISALELDQLDEGCFQFGRPDHLDTEILLPITCGDLGGNNAQEVEHNLEHFFYLARKWGCVLLLDESDVFLSERMPGNIVQNSLVSVFLRVLEYYSGILILTTNRVGQFNEAALSRVHTTLFYTNLNEGDTLRI
ncbi:uncharacterized protein ASPGLDRAFT_84664 [Aspergillus glaucus CBS 516.65]|uniref:ATPase AAA-type core domain-containing protein n=1 Tax=Aspergillus glaucus CBS 516.65 TaxID=1160497 RepID=A0A1L9VBG9_ASPGL|nr:hypothetical protein ASPGLDRAFT_84664 [Aspergillus glaucus CBS 516.65]OJJ81253.1 hypothetical protein ASPGLDRAFT_84664 [Aspergillus glaucus CBS 516.65]